MFFTKIQFINELKKSKCFFKQISVWCWIIKINLECNCNNDKKLKFWHTFSNHNQIEPYLYILKKCVKKWHTLNDRNFRIKITFLKKEMFGTHNGTLIIFDTLSMKNNTLIYFIGLYPEKNCITFNCNWLEWIECFLFKRKKKEK